MSASASMSDCVLCLDVDEEDADRADFIFFRAATMRLIAAV
jgi:hypothetical protein